MAKRPPTDPDSTKDQARPNTTTDPDTSRDPAAAAASPPTDPTRPGGAIDPTPTGATEPAAASPGGRAASADRVELVSRYAELGIADLVRFHNGRASVDRATFETLRSKPEFGFGTDFHVFDPPAANAA